MVEQGLGLQIVGPAEQTVEASAARIDALSDSPVVPTALLVLLTLDLAGEHQVAQLADLPRLGLPVDLLPGSIHQQVCQPLVQGKCKVVLNTWRR